MDGTAPFVGREPELALLLQAMAEAGDGRGRLALVEGEPGIGKTRLADELASAARGRGVRVAWGRCWEGGGAPAYWPWVQALRACARSLTPQQLRSAVGEGDGELAQLLPELEPLTGRRADTGDEAEGARFRLFYAAVRFLVAVARDAPLLLVLDDLHAADTPSLLLLRFLAADLADSRLLVVATFRPPVFGTEQILRGTMAELVREPVTIRIELRGLTQDAVATILEQTTGSVPSPAVVAAITTETEGNSLFVTELGRLLHREGRSEEALLGAAWRQAIPAGVREVIRERLVRLPERTSRLMTLAAVLGREFSLEVLAEAANLPRSDVAEALDDTESVLEAVPGAIGRLRFGHSLVREVLYDELAPVRRSRLHAAPRRRSNGSTAPTPLPTLPSWPTISSRPLSPLSRLGRSTTHGRLLPRRRRSSRSRRPSASWGWPFRRPSSSPEATRGPVWRSSSSSATPRPDPATPTGPGGRSSKPPTSPGAWGRPRTSPGQRSATEAASSGHEPAPTNRSSLSWRMHWPAWGPGSRPCGSASLLDSPGPSGTRWTWDAETS